MKNKYLYQLIITSSILIIIPTIVFFSVFLKKSYEEINRNHTEYYENISKLFCGTIINEISEFKKTALEFSLDSRVASESTGIFSEGIEKISQNEYYYWEAANILLKYGEKTNYDNFGIYYYDQEIILCDGYKYSVERFIKDFLQYNVSEDEKDKIRSFFLDKFYLKSKTLFAPVYDQEGICQSMLVGVCVRIGKENERALCFYQMKSDNMEFFYQSVKGRTWETYYVMDSNTGEVLFGLGDLDKEKLVSGFNVAEINRISNSEEEKSKDGRHFFAINNKRYGLTCLIDVSRNIEQNNIMQFYNEMKTFIGYILMIMTIICCMAVYYNYRPIHRLLQNIQENGNDEFEIILNKLENQNMRLTEQRMLIMDLLMNHLIYGLPISKEHINKLGVSDSLNYYCVFVIDDYVLESMEVEIIMEEIEKKFQTIVFVTDMQDEKSTIVIAFMEKDNAYMLETWLKEWCKENIRHHFDLFTGCTVNHLNDINKSMEYCKKQLSKHKNNKGNERRSNAKNANNYEQLKKNVLLYLEENYSNRDLSQSMVADYFSISVYSLSRMFKQHFGVGFSDYVTKKRLEKAKYFLTNSSMSIGEIATQVGFSEANYFSRLFRQNEGVSPSEYRNEEKFNN